MNQITSYKSSSLYTILQQLQFECMDINNSSISINTSECEYDKDCCRFYKIKRLSFDEKYPMREAFENILLTLDDKCFKLVYIIDSDKRGISVYIGVVKKEKQAVSALSAYDIGELIKSAFESNYNGSELEQLGFDCNDVRNLLKPRYEEFRRAGCIIGVPSINKNDSADNVDFQGMDRLINSMLGCKWRLVVTCEAEDKKTISDLRQKVYDLYNCLAPLSNSSVQASQNNSDSHSETDGYSTTRGTSRGVNESRSHSKENETVTKGITDNESKSYSENISRTSGSTNGSAVSVSWEATDKQAKVILDYIDNELLPRLNTGCTRGMYRTSVKYMAQNNADAVRLKNNILALFKGNDTTFNSLKAMALPVEDNHYFLIGFPEINYNSGEFNETLLLKCIPQNSLCTYLTPQEVSIIATPPQKEVPGLPLRENVEFGLNYKKPDNGKVVFGNIIQSGRKLNIPFELDKNIFSKHTFIAGVTGSGKTTTCHSILKELCNNNNMHFLIIEPAKTEYRVLLNSQEFNDVVVFTLGNELTAPLRFNPFEILEGELLSSHIDMLKAAFTSAFPMEASMPQILEEAIISCYEDRGWDIQLNTNKNSEDQCYKFPVLSDLTNKFEQVVKKKGFGDRLQSEYIGSLVSRISNLTKGTKGKMLDCYTSTDFDFILNHNVIIEMDDMKASEDKALIMGLLLMRLGSAVKIAHKNDNSFRHLTLVEEAHRLLARTDYSDSGAKKSAVETFTDMLAEVRKYGEGLIIVDQIPNKLAPEVLKNTNTKIIHKILARDDKEAVGDTMLMNDKQKEFLSALQTGEAVVFSENTPKPIHISVKKVTDTNEAEVTDERVKKVFDNKVPKTKFNDFVSFVYPAFDKFAKKRNAEAASDAFEIFLKQWKKSDIETNLSCEEAIKSLCTIRAVRTGKQNANPDTWEEIRDKAADYCKKCIENGQYYFNQDILKYLN